MPLKQSIQRVRVRLAPSPTGNLHVGTARTALYNWLFARKYGGQFVLRIEDTDQKRSTKAHEANIIAGLKWLGFNWDEGPDKPGAFGPYRQTERLDIYRRYLDELLKKKKAYYCYCTAEELDRERAKQTKAGLAPIYQRRCCNLSPAEGRELRRQRPRPVVRFRVPDQKVIKFTDLVRGDLEFNTKDIGDFVIAKSDGTPLFLLANVVDDALMGITHVIRGEDHLPNVPKQILLFNSLKFKTPTFGHLSLILNPDKSKMSKRAGPTHIEEYKKLGYLPGAFINYMALLGWNPGSTQEIFSPEQLVAEFTLEGLNKAGAVFDLKRLQWMNAQYISRLSPAQLVAASKNFLPAAVQKISPPQLQKMLITLRDRLHYLSEVPELIRFYLADELTYDPRLLIWKKGSNKSTLNVLNKIINHWEKLFEAKPSTPDEIEQSLRAFAQQEGLTIGELFWPLRVALSGLKASPGPQEIIWALGPQISLKRLKRALNMISGA